MKKLRFLFVAALFLGLNLNAQDNNYEAGQWHFGPHIGASLGSYTGTGAPDAFYGGYDFGVYGGYSFTDLIGVNLSALYGYENWMGKKVDFVKVPALFLLQFNSSHLGLGFQYNHLLSKLGGIGYKSFIDNHVSGVIEYGFFSSVFHLSSGGITAGSSIIRSLIRVGYALTPKTYTRIGQFIDGVKQHDEEYAYNPFFFEIAIQYNIGQHFNDKKYTRKRTRRR